MRNGFLISKILKSLVAPANNDRLARAMFVANAVAFHVPLNPALDANANADLHQKFFRDICSGVNENLALDTRKAQSLFRELISVRYQLLTGVIDPSLVQAALCSDTMRDGLTREEFAMSEWLGSRSDFIRCQLEMADVLRQVDPEA